MWESGWGTVQIDQDYGTNRHSLIKPLTYFKYLYLLYNVQLNLKGAYYK